MNEVEVNLPVQTAFSFAADYTIEEAAEAAEAVETEAYDEAA
jgi:hypothetical protein